MAKNIVITFRAALTVQTCSLTLLGKFACARITFLVVVPLSILGYMKLRVLTLFQSPIQKCLPWPYLHVHVYSFGSLCECVCVSKKLIYNDIAQWSLVGKIQQKTFWDVFK